MIERIKESNGFMTKAGELLDYVEWHVFVRGILLPFLALSFHLWFDIGLILYFNAVLIPFALGFDVIQHKNKWLKRLQKESHYFLIGNSTVFLLYGIYRFLIMPLGFQVIG